MIIKWLRFSVIVWLFPVAVWAQTVSVVPSTTTYVPTGGTVSFTVTLTYTGAITAVGFQIGSVPAGWSFVSAGGSNPPAIVPALGSTSAFEFAYTTTPASPATFTFTAAYPAGLVGSQIFSSVSGSLRPGPVTVSGTNVVLTSSTTVGAPAITRQPSGAALADGDNYVLAVEASGSAPLAYQWRKDAVAIVGATTASLTLTAVKAADAAGYSVVVTNPQGSVTSVVAVLSVEPVPIAPTITSSAVAQSASAGSDVTFSVVAAGTAPFTYQWLRAGQALAGATGATLTLRAVQKTDEGTYSVEVSNKAGRAVSAGAVLTVSSTSVAPVIASQPIAQSAPLGGSVTFTVVAVGTAPLSYQWRRGGQVLAGATGSTLTLTNVQKTDENSYSVAVSNVSGTVQSVGAAFTLLSGFAAPTITTQPVAQSAPLGGSVTFAVIANGTPPLAYQWLLGGLALAGATGASLSVPSVQNSHYGTYSVFVSNPAGSVTSAGATLSGSTAPVAPEITTQPLAKTVEVGGTASFAVVAVGSAPLVYQWKKDGQPLSGASAAGASLTLTSVQSQSAGTYSVTVTNAAGTVTSAGAALLVSAPVPPPAASRLANLSVRSVAGSGEQTLIVGFAVGGTGVKSVLLRGVGPGLTQFGLPGALGDPQLRLFDSTSVQTHINEDWGGSGTLAAAFSGVGAFALPATSKDAALLVPLGGGAYTAQISGNGGTGIALVEVYDSDVGGSAARLTNLSARTQVGTGDDILVVGFVVTGTGPTTLLLRAVGPGLVQFGLGGALADPRLQLFNAAGVLVVGNDDWGGGASLSAAFSQVGAFALPPTSKDAVLLSTLPAGAYTVQISGANATRGIALVEVYELP